MGSKYLRRDTVQEKADATILGSGGIYLQPKDDSTRGLKR